jgi:hypothetical protein
MKTKEIAIVVQNHQIGFGQAAENGSVPSVTLRR